MNKKGKINKLSALRLTEKKINRPASNKKFRANAKKLL